VREKAGLALKCPRLARKSERESEIISRHKIALFALYSRIVMYAKRITEINHSISIEAAAEDRRENIDD